MQADLRLGQLLTQLVSELARGISIGQGRAVGHHRVGVRSAFLPRQLAGQPGRFDQLFGIHAAHAFHGPDRDPQRYRHAPVFHRCAREHRQQQRGLGAGQRQLVAGQNQQELIVPYTANRCRRRDLLAQVFAYGAQHGIAGIPSEDMVDVAERQDVDVHAAEWAAGAQLRKLPAQDPSQSHQVGQAGQIVALGDLLEGGSTPCVDRHFLHSDLEAIAFADAGFQHPHAVLTGTGDCQFAVVLAALFQVCQKLLGHRLAQQGLDVRGRMAGQVTPKGIGSALVPALQRAVVIDAQQGHG